MSILYRDFCGAAKQLNQIVFAGAHDAGISAGRHNVKTQHVGIRLQANSGVRIFDVRITDTPIGMASFHGNSKLDPSEKHKRGAYGEALQAILTEAKDFVENEGNSEFLILKFDKCKNYRRIAAECLYILGNRLYKGTGSLNTKTLTQLQGHVITVFTNEGLTEIGGLYNSTHGIFGCKSLARNENHDPNYNGIQYYGKGGTDPFKFYKSQDMKIKENRQTQKKLMRQGMSTTDRDVMGMMYWTSTGLLESIKERNDKMWSIDKHSHKSMESVWDKLLVEAIGLRTGNINGAEYSAGGILKVYMPNIVMIDFADGTKGNIIKELNTITATRLVKAFQEDHRRANLRVI